MIGIGKMIDLDKIANFAREIHSVNNDGHAFDHIERVVALAKKILIAETSADDELVLVSCYLHDTYDEKLTTDVPAQKANVKAFLLTLTNEVFIEKTFEIIDHMSFSSNLEQKFMLDINGKIVQDADRLDAMGAWGIVRTLEYGWSRGREFYNPDIQVQKYLSKSDYHGQEKNTTINHFYEKLFLLKDLLNTAEGQRLGSQRHQIMLDFVSSIELEYDETHPSAFHKNL